MKPVRPARRSSPHAWIGVACLGAAAFCLPAVAQQRSSATSALNRVALNPQPLPPKLKVAPPAPAQERSIIIVGGRKTRGAASGR